jgi:hypothetical protein
VVLGLSAAVSEQLTDLGQAMAVVERAISLDAQKAGSFILDHAVSTLHRQRIVIGNFLNGGNSGAAVWGAREAGVRGREEARSA